MRRKPLKWAAKLVILKGNKMTPEGRKEVAKWLKRQAKFLKEDGDLMEGRYTAHYLY